MQAMPSAPAPDELARWLLAAEGGAHVTPEELALAVQTYERLRAHLAIYLGSQGFDALWARALQLARRTVPWKGDADPSAAPASPHRLEIAARGRDAAETHAVLLAIFTQFLALLFTFIGADLGFRLLHQCWPALPAPTVRAHTEESQS
jgi:hypothetical protein